MSTIESLRRCYHCGAVLQTEDPSKGGYIDVSVVREHTEKEVLLCDACYQKQRYNRYPAGAKASEDFLTMLKDARASDAMMVNVVDLTSFECSFDPAVSELINGLKMIVIGNKRDLMPSYRDEDLKQYIVYVFQEYGIEIKPEDVFLTSLLSSSDITPIAEEIQRRRQGHDVYIIGAAGAGKSLFLQAFLNTYRNPSNHAVGVSQYYGTNLNVLKIPLDSSSYIFDTPRSELSNSFARYREDVALQKVLFTDQPFSNKKGSLSKGGSLFISTLARIDYLLGKGGFSFSSHFPAKVQLKTVSMKKDMDALFMKYHEKKALKPHASFIHSIMDYDVFDINVTEIGRREISIAGLGWLSFKNEGETKIRIYVPKGIGVYSGKAKGHR